MRCRGCGNTRSKVRKGYRPDYTLYTMEALPPRQESSTRCAFAEPALGLTGVTSFEFLPDTCVEDKSEYGFSQGLGRGECEIAPCYLLHVPRFEQTKAKGKREKILMAPFIAWRKLRQVQLTFKRIGLAVINFDTESSKEQWFNTTWASIACPETTITLV
ncbi:hypothetical protein BJX96DRAFT_138698 [Aspergillus floccosus]